MIKRPAQALQPAQIERQRRKFRIAHICMLRTLYLAGKLKLIEQSHHRIAHLARACFSRRVRKEASKAIHNQGRPCDQRRMDITRRLRSSLGTRQRDIDRLKNAADTNLPNSEVLIWSG